MRVYVIQWWPRRWRMGRRARCGIERHGASDFTAPHHGSRLLPLQFFLVANRRVVELLARLMYQEQSPLRADDYSLQRF